MSYKHSDVIRSLLRIDIYARRTLVAVEGRCFCFVSACRFRRKSPRFPKAFFALVKGAQIDMKHRAGESSARDVEASPRVAELKRAIK
jgi:hypothetical protein